MVLKTHLEPFREPLRVPPVGQPKNRIFSKSVGRKCWGWNCLGRGKEGGQGRGYGGGWGDREGCGRQKEVEM